MQINVTHTVTEDNEWKLDYSATTDAVTIIAMTNHAYFNLNANIGNTATVLEHELLMPTGERQPLAKSAACHRHAAHRRSCPASLMYSARAWVPENAATKMQDVTGAPDYHLIPTGKINEIVANSAWDFTTTKPIGKDIDKGDVTAAGAPRA